MKVKILLKTLRPYMPQTNVPHLEDQHELMHLSKTVIKLIST